MTDNAYLIISPQTGLVAAVLEQQHAEQLARDYGAVVRSVPVIFDGRGWEARARDEEDA